MSLTLVLLTTIGVVLGGNLLLVGLPGGLLLSLASVLVKPLGWPGINDLGDRAWPLAILTTAGWGAGLIPVWWLASRWLGWPDAAVWALWVGWGMLLSVGMLAYCRFK